MSSPSAGLKRGADSEIAQPQSNNPVNGPARKKSRFTDAVNPSTPVTTQNASTNNATANVQSTSTTTNTTATTITAANTTQSLAEKARALKERVEALKRSKLANSSTASTAVSTPANNNATVPNKPATITTTATIPTSNITNNPYLSTAVDTQRYRAFTLHTEAGKHTAVATAMRIKQLTQTISKKQQNDKSLISTAPNIVQQYLQQTYSVQHMPCVESWDTALLHNIDNVYDDNNINIDKITSYIYHPITLNVVGEPPVPPPQPVPLTRRERRKVKKHLRAQVEQERQDRIKLGLDAPPEAKLRIRNLHNTLLMDSVADPTALEFKIKQQVADRKQKHLQDNKERQLTAEQKKEKAINKYTSDTSVYTYVQLYRIPVFNHQQIKFKLAVNAEQLRLTGVCIQIVNEDNANSALNGADVSYDMIVVEGGRKALKRYHRLLTHRIDWTHAVVNKDNNNTNAQQHNIDDMNDDTDDDDTIVAGSNKYVQLVWSGTVTKSAFNKFTVEQTRTEYGARKLLERYNVEHYYQLVKNYKPAV